MLISHIPAIVFFGIINDNFKNARGSLQFKYISMKNCTKLELDCLQFFDRYFDLDGRILNDEESN